MAFNDRRNEEWALTAGWSDTKGMADILFLLNNCCLEKQYTNKTRKQQEKTYITYKYFN